MTSRNSPNSPKMQALREKYGPCFIDKLPMYRTATLDRECVALIAINPQTLVAWVLLAGIPFLCKLEDLDNFCL